MKRRLLALDRLGEMIERHERVAYVIRPFHIVSVGREQQIELTEKAAGSVTLRSIKRAIHV